MAPEQLPIERGNRLPPHLRLPKPHGLKWQKLKLLRLSRDKSTCEENEQVTQEAVTNIKHQLQQQKHAFRATGILDFDNELEKPLDLRNSLEQPRRGRRRRDRAIQTNPNGSARSRIHTPGPWEHEERSPLLRNLRTVFNTQA